MAARDGDEPNAAVPTLSSLSSFLCQLHVLLGDFSQIPATISTGGGDGGGVSKRASFSL